VTPPLCTLAEGEDTGARMEAEHEDSEEDGEDGEESDEQASSINSQIRPRPEEYSASTDSADESQSELPPDGFNFPDGICVDSEGTIFVSDGGNHRIVTLDDAYVDGNFMTYAGGFGGDGWLDAHADDAMFNGPTGLTIDPKGHLIIADQENHAIRKVDPKDGGVTTVAGCLEEGFADGPAADAKFNCPTGVACDKLGNIFVVDGGNHRIRKVSVEGMVSTFAGTGKKGFKDGAGAQAMFNHPGGIATDKEGNVYVADYGNHRIRILSSKGVAKTLAGNGEKGYRDGAALSAMFSFPQGIAVCPKTGDVIIADYGNEYIRALSKEGVVRTVAGTGEPELQDGLKDQASFNQPRGVACDKDGNIFVADRGNHAVRKIDVNTGVTDTIKGDGEAYSSNDNPGGHAGGDGCEDDCCIPAPMLRKLDSKRAKTETDDGAQDVVVTKKTATQFGVLAEADDTWG